MRQLSVCALLLAFFAVPAFSQNGPAPIAPATSSSSADNSTDFTALREQVARQNKTLNDQVAAQRAVVKKNQELLKEAQKLQVANQKLAEEKKKLEAQNADLQKQGEVLNAATR